MLTKEECDKHVGQFTSGECFTRFINKVSPIMKDIKEVKCMGAGSFGIVMSCTGTYKGKKNFPFALKVNVPPLYNEGDPAQEDLLNEIKTSIDMSNKNIGPEVYAAFTMEDGRCPLMYMLMEKYEGDCAQLLMDSRTSPMECIAVIKGMIEILYTLIYKYKKICNDVKPGNFVCNRSPMKVRMIDFDSTFCNNVIKKITLIDETFTILLIQLSFMCALSIKNNKTSRSHIKMIFENTFFKNNWYPKLKKDNEKLFNSLYTVIDRRNNNDRHSIGNTFAHYTGWGNRHIFELGFIDFMNYINNS